MKELKQAITWTSCSPPTPCEDAAAEREADRADRKALYEMQIAKENATPGVLHLRDGYDCPICLNRGYTCELECNGGCYDVAMRLCACRRVRENLATLRRNGLDRLAETCTLESYRITAPWQETVLGQAKAYLGAMRRGERPWFFFGGTSGCGKTHICTALAVTLLREGLPMQYMLWRDESTRIKGLVNDAAYTKEAEKFKKAPLLYIDDLFKTGRSESQRRQRPTGADINLAFEIISARYNARLPTIISSESLLREIIAFDEAIGGRIKEMCGQFHLDIAEDNAKNYRLKGISKYSACGERREDFSSV